MCLRMFFVERSLVLKKLFNTFTKGEKLLWFSSVFLIVLSFVLFDREDFVTLTASLIGVTSLIFAAKGNPIGPMLMIIFSVLYGIISFYVSYYGEMVTYLGMTLPMSVLSLASWLKNPHNGNKSEVKINRIHKKEIVFLCFLTAGVTVMFYFILSFFGTANIYPSTFSVTTSFAAAYLTFRRSPYFALAYALNDVVLIVLWVLASITDISYVCVTVCFIVFLANDLYGFISWRKIEKRQKSE